MEAILKKTRVEVSPKLYFKEPYSSELGALIVKEGTQLIQEIGFEQFTFKKLAQGIGSTEAAIYRYFENKHMLLLYLNAWYWGWMEHNLVFLTSNIPDPRERLNIGLGLMVDGPRFLDNEFLDLRKLRTVAINESIKGYFTRSVDAEHRSGLFAQVYSFGERIATIVRELNPEYSYPKTLVYTVMHASLLRSFNSLHLPEMIEIDSQGVESDRFFHQLVFKSIANVR
jgi:AcrR family transcriptional regulator